VFSRPSRLWHALIKDKDAFGQSMQRIMELDFDRIIPGHGELIETNAKPIFEKAFTEWLSD
jgi:glyoxylase-like metal-dependent hydrolase (beta-lactamase superfamily II)